MSNENTTGTADTKAPKEKDKGAKNRVEVQGGVKPEPGTAHTFKNGAGTTVKTFW
jgi:hypothetical protein